MCNVLTVLFIVVPTDLPELQELLEKGSLRWASKPPVLRKKLLDMLQAMAGDLQTMDAATIFADKVFNTNLVRVLKEHSAEVNVAKPPKSRASQGSGAGLQTPPPTPAASIALNRKASFEEMVSLEKALEVLEAIHEGKLRDLIQALVLLAARKVWPSYKKVWKVSYVDIEKFPGFVACLPSVCRNGRNQLNTDLVIWCQKVKAGKEYYWECFLPQVKGLEQWQKCLETGEFEAVGRGGVASLGLFWSMLKNEGGKRRLLGAPVTMSDAEVDGLWAEVVDSLEDNTVMALLLPLVVKVVQVKVLEAVGKNNVVPREVTVPIAISDIPLLSSVKLDCWELANAYLRLLTVRGGDTRVPYNCLTEGYAAKYGYGCMWVTRTGGEEEDEVVSGEYFRKQTAEKEKNKGTPGWTRKEVEDCFQHDEGGSGEGRFGTGMGSLYGSDGGGSGGGGGGIFGTRRKSSMSEEEIQDMIEQAHRDYDRKAQAGLSAFMVGGPGGGGRVFREPGSRSSMERSPGRLFGDIDAPEIVDLSVNDRSGSPFAGYEENRRLRLMQPDRQNEFGRSDRIGSGRFPDPPNQGRVSEPSRERTIGEDRGAGGRWGGKGEGGRVDNAGRHGSKHARDPSDQLDRYRWSKPRHEQNNRNW